MRFESQRRMKESDASGNVRAGEREGKEVLTLRAEELRKKLDGIVQSNDGLRKFMDRCELPMYSYHLTVEAELFA